MDCLKPILKPSCVQVLFPLEGHLDIQSKNLCQEKKKDAKGMKKREKIGDNVQERGA